MSGNWTFPSYSKSCPICGEKHCAIHIGFYYRYAYDSVSGTVIQLPIARYLCQRKGKVQKGAHKTFSLLPSQLIPYCLYDIPVLIFMAVLYLQGLSLLDIAAEFAAQYDIPLSSAAAAEYIALFSRAYTKANTLFKDKFPSEGKFLEHLKVHNPVNAAMATWEKYRVFLFGTPSQDRF